MGVILSLIWILPILAIAGLIILIIKSKDFLNPKTAVAVVVGVIIVSAVMIPLLSSTTDDSRNTNTIYYDDYVQTYATSASGALELVTVGSVTYAHADDVGIGTLTYSDNSTKTFTVQKATLDVFLLNGQSNIQYNTELANVSQASPVPALGQAYYFGTTTQAYNPTTRLSDCTIQDVVALDGTAKIGRIETPFSAEYTKLTGHKVLTVNTAVGGKSISTFQPPNGDMYTRTVTGWSTALALVSTSYYDIHIKGMVWCQGEADTYETVSWYKEKFNTMFNALKSLDSNAIDTCYIDLIRSIRGLNSRTAQIQLADSESDVFIATTIADTFTVANGLVGSDNVHYTQLGQNLVGVDIATYIASQGV